MFKHYIILLFKLVCVLTGERKRKILCSRESDRVVVSDQRCYGAARPAVVTEPCNTECELRFALKQASKRISQPGDILTNRPVPLLTQVVRGS